MLYSFWGTDVEPAHCACSSKFKKHIEKKTIFWKHENGVMLESTVAHIKNLTYIYIHTYIHTYTHTHTHTHTLCVCVCVCVCVSLDLSKKLSKTFVAATRPSNFLGSLRRRRSKRLPSLFSHLCLRESVTVR